MRRAGFQRGGGPGLVGVRQTHKNRPAAHFPKPMLHQRRRGGLIVRDLQQRLGGMLATIKRGGVRKGATPIFIHTGGAFGLMARRDLFE